MRKLKNFCSKADGGKTDRETVEEVMGKYNGMHENQLIDELMKKVKEQKQNGTFDVESIENFVKNVSPHLSNEQRQKLKNLITVINCE